MKRNWVIPILQVGRVGDMLFWLLTFEQLAAILINDHYDHNDGYSISELVSAIVNVMMISKYNYRL